MGDQYCWDREDVWYSVWANGADDESGTCGGDEFLIYEILS